MKVFLQPELKSDIRSFEPKYAALLSNGDYVIALFAEETYAKVYAEKFSPYVIIRKLEKHSL